MTAITVTEETTEPVRRSAYAFLKEHVGTDTVMAYMSSQKDAELGGRTLLLRAESDGNTVGVVYLGTDYEDAYFSGEAGMPQVARVIAARVLMLHGIATHPNYRRQGIASALLRAAEESAATEVTDVILGVVNGDESTDRFYTAHGYRVGPNQRPLLLRVGHDRVMLPQDGPDSRWFHKRTPAALAGKPVVTALSPNENQLRMLASHTDSEA